MYLLDKNKRPTNTILYISAIIYGIIEDNMGIDYSTLLKLVTLEREGKETNPTFFSLALDFLYLLEKIYLDDKGELHAIKKNSNN